MVTEPSFQEEVNALWRSTQAGCGECLSALGSSWGDFR